MVILLFIATLGIMSLGYLIMYRLDNFIETGGISDSPQGRANQGILIYGEPETTAKLQKAGIKCRTLTTLMFPEQDLYSALFALSADDSSNLAICHSARCIDPGITIIARCNMPEFQSIYETIGTSKLLNANESLDSLLAELWGIEQ